MTIADRAASSAGSPGASPSGGGRKGAGVVAEIAARRLADVVAELDALGREGLRRLVAEAPEPRPVAEALADPGLHLIAEVKRRSPSAGVIAPGGPAAGRGRGDAGG